MSAEINLFEFVRSGQSRVGSLSLSDMRRLDIAEREGGLQWQITGFAGRQNKLFFDLGIDGTVAVTCQRCLEPVQLKLALQRHFLVAKTEQEADSVPLDDDGLEVVVGSENFDVSALVEDEVILSLPLVPMHPLCRHPASVAVEKTAEKTAMQAAADHVERKSPFANLADLKQSSSGPKN